MTETPNLVRGAQPDYLVRKEEVADMPPLALPPELFLVVSAGAHLLDEGGELGDRTGVERAGSNRVVDQFVDVIHQPVVPRRDVHVPHWVHAFATALGLCNCNSKWLKLTVPIFKALGQQ